MIQTTVLIVLAALAVVAIGGVYFMVIQKHLSVASIAMDKPTIVANAKGFFGKVNAYLVNLKTVILGVVASLSGVYSIVSTDTLQAWGALPWANVVDQKVASWITIACTVLIPIVHSQGLAKAAVTEPSPAVDTEGR